MIDVAASPSAARTGTDGPPGRPNRRSLLAALGLVANFGLGGCSGGPLYRYRYKLTLDVEANGRVFRNANVVEVRKQGPGPNHLPTEMVSTAVIGEANVIDLGAGRLLVAILTSRKDEVGPDGIPRTGWDDASPQFLLQRLYHTPRLGMTDAGLSPGLDALALQRGAHEIGPEDLPTLVTFRNSVDPLTVEQVDPNDLAATFGPGVRLLGATLEITDEPITRGIEAKLPWLGGLHGSHLDGQIYSPAVGSLANTLSPSDFKRKGM